MVGSPGPLQYILRVLGLRKQAASMTVACLGGSCQRNLLGSFRLAASLEGI
jgi:hypothetical protein